MTIQAVC